MIPGAIQVDDVSRRFRVHGREARTLKDLFVQRGRTEPQDVWALRGVNAVGRARARPSASSGGTAPASRRCCGSSPGSSSRPRVGSRRAGGSARCSSSAPGSIRTSPGARTSFLNGSIQGLPRRLIRERFDEIVAFAELEHAIDRPVRTYSSGMYMRLGFAIAAFLDADMLLLDEVFAVGDEAFQRKCFGRIFEFKQRGGTIVFVSHDARRRRAAVRARGAPAGG